MDSDDDIAFQIRPKPLFNIDIKNRPPNILLASNPEKPPLNSSTVSQTIPNETQSLDSNVQIFNLLSQQFSKFSSNLEINNLKTEQISIKEKIGKYLRNAEHYKKKLEDCERMVEMLNERLAQNNDLLERLIQKSQNENFDPVDDILSKLKRYSINSKQVKPEENRNSKSKDPKFILPNFKQEIPGLLNPGKKQDQGFNESKPSGPGMNPALETSKLNNVFPTSSQIPPRLTAQTPPSGPNQPPQPIKNKPQEIPTLISQLPHLISEKPKILTPPQNLPFNPDPDTKEVPSTNTKPANPPNIRSNEPQKPLENVPIPNLKLLPNSNNQLDPVEPQVSEKANPLIPQNKIQNISSPPNLISPLMQNNPLIKNQNSGNEIPGRSQIPSLIENFKSPVQELGPENKGNPLKVPVLINSYDKPQTANANKSPFNDEKKPLGVFPGELLQTKSGFNLNFQNKNRPEDVVILGLPNANPEKISSKKDESASPAKQQIILPFAQPPTPSNALPLPLPQLPTSSNAIPNLNPATSNNALQFPQPPTPSNALPLPQLPTSSNAIPNLNPPTSNNALPCPQPPTPTPTPITDLPFTQKSPFALLFQNQNQNLNPKPIPNLFPQMPIENKIPVIKFPGLIPTQNPPKLSEANIPALNQPKILGIPSPQNLKNTPNPPVPPELPSNPMNFLKPDNQSNAKFNKPFPINEQRTGLIFPPALLGNGPKIPPKQDLNNFGTNHPPNLIPDSSKPLIPNPPMAYWVNKE